MALSDLFIRLKADASGFKAGMNSAKKEAGLTSKSVKEAENKFYSLQVQLKKADYGSDKWRKLKTDISAARIEMEKMRKESGLMSQKGGIGNEFISGLKGGIVGGGVAGVGMALASGISAGISSTLTLITDFDDAIRRVAASSQASTSELATLKKAAIDWGGASKFTSMEAADALNYLALAGWNVKDSISGLPGVLKLAASTNTELGLTAEILADAMSSFGIDASRSVDIAGVFAQAQAKSTSSVEQLGESMTYAASNMATANQTIEDTAALLALLANRGIKGSMAGTALNAMLNDMKKNAKNGAIAFGEMNISLYDQEGRFRKIFDIIGEMRTGLQGLTTQQRDAITGGLFDERSIKAINVLMNATTAEIDDMAYATNNTIGVLDRMEATMEGGVGGAMRKAQGAWEAFQISLGSGEGMKSFYEGSASIADSLRHTKEEFDEAAKAVNPFIDNLKKVLIFSGLFQQITKDIQIAQSTRDLSKPLKEAGLLGFTKTKKQTMPIGVLAPPKDIEASDPESKKRAAERANNIKTAAQAYKEVQAELLKTREYLSFVGQETDYVGEATQILQRQMETIFKMGGDEAVRYAELLRSEMQSLVDESRKTDNTQPVTMLPTLSMGSVSSQTGDPLSGVVNKQSEENANAFNDKLIQQEQLLYNIAQASQVMGDAAFAGFANMASGAATAGSAMLQFGSQAAAGIMEMVRANIMAAISEQAKANSFLGIIGVPLIGAAIGAIFGLMQGAMGKTKGIALAEGGVTTGPTYAMIGDNPSKKELVLPFEKNNEFAAAIGRYMGGSNKGGIGEVRFEIAGDKLYGVLQRVDRKMSKFQ